MDSNLAEQVEQANLLRTTEQFHEGAELIKTVILRGADASICDKFCHELRRVGKQAEAIALLNSVIGVTNKNSMSLVANLAGCYRESGDALKGAALAKSYLDLDKENPWLYNEVFTCLLWGGAHQAAYAEARAFYELTSNTHCISQMVEAAIAGRNADQVIDIIKNNQSVLLSNSNLDAALQIIESSGRSEYSLSLLFSQLKKAEARGADAVVQIRRALMHQLIRFGLAPHFIQLTDGMELDAHSTCDLLYAMFQCRSYALGDIERWLKVRLSDGGLFGGDLLRAFCRLGFTESVSAIWLICGADLVANRRPEVFDFIRYATSNAQWALLQPHIPVFIELVCRRDAFGESLRIVLSEELPRSDNSPLALKILTQIKHVEHCLKQRGLTGDHHVAIDTLTVAESEAALKIYDWSNLFASTGVYESPTSTKNFLERPLFRKKLLSGRPMSDAVVERRVDFRFIPDFVSFGDFYSPAPPWLKIVRFWDSDAVPTEVEEMINISRKINEAVENIVFSDKTALQYIMKHAPTVGDFWKKCQKPAFRADIFRIIFLYNEGGVWIDADEMAINPIAHVDFSLLKNLVASCYGEYYGGYYANNDFLICPPGHYLCASVYHSMLRNVDNLSNSDVSKIDYYHYFGPGLWSRQIAELMNTETQVDGITLLSRVSKDYFFRTMHLEYKNNPAKNWRLSV